MADYVQYKMSYENSLMLAVFRQSATRSGPFLKILKVLASFQNVLQIIPTCWRWNYIVSKNEVICESIWYRIAQEAYNSQVFEELE
jgi:hypothetical protein